MSKTPRYEVHSITGYNALGSGVSGEGKLGTTYWVADTEHNFQEVPLRIVCSGKPGWRWAGRLTHFRLVAERNCARLNREHDEWLASA